MNYLPKQQQEYKPPLIANENAYLGDVATSEDNDSEKPVSCGFYRLEKGQYTNHDLSLRSGRSRGSISVS